MFKVAAAAVNCLKKKKKFSYRKNETMSKCLR